MSKVPCGGFELGESLIMKDGKLDTNGDFIVTFTIDDSENIVSDKTFDEIFEACKAGKKVSAMLVNGPNNYIEFHLSVASGKEFDFFMLTVPNGKIMYGAIRISSNNNIKLYSGSLTAGTP